jgi:carbon storage regulator CsrA
MLVLSRKQGQGLLIDGTTVIRVLEIRGKQIRLGIEAPVSVPVVRTELHIAQANVLGQGVTPRERVGPRENQIEENDRRDRAAEVRRSRKPR